MFGTEIIEVGIGLAFAYFAISIICSGIVELFVKITSLRAKHMKMALGTLLDDKNYNGFVGELYQHHLISSPLKDKLGDPTSIAAKNFSAAVLDILGKNDKLSESEQFKAISERIATIKNDDTRKRLQGILKSSAEDFDTMRAKIEFWFNESMEHVTEWYRQRMRFFVTLTSLVVVGVMNADTIKMATLFWNDDELRTATVQAAQGYSDRMESRMNATAVMGGDSATQVTDTTVTDSGTKVVEVSVKVVQNDSAQTMAELTALKDNLDQVYKDINEAKVLPIGWDTEILPGKGSSNPAEPIKWWILKICGLILTVGAVSLGSTYWYKQLKNLLSIRFGKSENQTPPEEPQAPSTAKSTPPSEENQEEK